MKRDDALHVTVPVLLGGLIYVAFRSPEHLLFQWAHAARLDGLVAALREICGSIRPSSEWLLFSLPDGLWLYGFACFMHVTWRGNGVEACGWRWLPLALALGSETAQGLGILQGTFDPADVVTYLAAFAVAAMRTPQPVEATT